MAVCLSHISNAEPLEKVPDVTKNYKSLEVLAYSVNYLESMYVQPENQHGQPRTFSNKRDGIKVRSSYDANAEKAFEQMTSDTKVNTVGWDYYLRGEGQANRQIPSGWKPC